MMDIKTLIKLTGMTQKQFAEYFKTSKRNVENWCEGAAKPSECLLELMIYKLSNEGIIKTTPSE